ncbi:AraC family transcriptional regulator [Pseudoflavitalea sp. G-6-1-2]|uniref:helix-turn-helix domain-containing protein n=1 Tax=Pseudoflavitalea sp. G-6-1-2 TaxID=2728841 RepID=UPI00146CDCAF|nr:helix-turn-helix domain-containing protein [Pseudoflavitalea sp. G-6-1-2]NML21433.1 AraC family transcriptional regulator [Pseudoflavitalea sp. G-6-1-2]
MSRSVLYKLDELNADPDFRQFPNVSGLSLAVSTPNMDHSIFKQQFRTDYLTILLVTKGEVECSVNFKKYLLRKNDMLLLAPASIKQVMSVSEGTAATYVAFTPAFLSRIGMPRNQMEVFEYYSSRYTPLWRLSTKDSNAINKFARLVEKQVARITEHPFGKEMLTHKFYLLLYEMAALGRKYAEQEPFQPSRKEHLVIRFVNLVQQQCKSHRSVQHYAGELNITPKYLTETVKEIAGKTAGEILDDYVLLEAKLLLDDPTYSISQIADELNFSDQSFFGKFFKRFTGLSPKEYRLSH